MYVTPIKGRIQIIGEDIDIIIDDEKCDHEDADGLYQHKTIYLRSEYPSVKEYAYVYRHECFHALCDLLGIQLDIHTEEVLAHRVSHMITYEI